MNASQAKIIAQASNEESIKQITNTLMYNIITCIYKVAKEGKFTMIYSFNTNAELKIVAAKLQKLGYKVRSCSGPSRQAQINMRTKLKVTWD